MALKERPEKTGEKYTIPTLLTVPEAARTLVVSRSMIYRFIERGEVKAVKLGGLSGRKRTARTDIARRETALSGGRSGNFFDSFPPDLQVLNGLIQVESARGNFFMRAGASLILLADPRNPRLPQDVGGERYGPQF